MQSYEAQFALTSFVYVQLKQKERDSGGTKNSREVALDSFDVDRQPDRKGLAASMQHVASLSHFALHHDPFIDRILPLERNQTVRSTPSSEYKECITTRAETINTVWYNPSRSSLVRVHLLNTRTVGSHDLDYFVQPVASTARNAQPQGQGNGKRLVGNSYFPSHSSSSTAHCMIDLSFLRSIKRRKVHHSDFKPL